MARLRFRYLIPVLLLSVGLYGESLSENFRFIRMKTEHGLMNSSVSGIAQDSYGFLWFASQGGLSRYDGYNYRHYTKVPFDDESLPHDLVQSIYSDGGDRIWAGTYYGAAVIDLKSGELHRYMPDPQDSESMQGAVVTSFSRDSDRRLWIGTLKGLNRLDEDSGRFVHYLDEISIRALFLDSTGTLWVGSYEGLYRYRSETDDFYHYPSAPDREGALRSPYVMSIAEDPDGTIWLGTWGGGGLARLSSDRREIISYTLPAEEIYVINCDERGRVWAGSWGKGLCAFYPEEKRVLRFGEEELGNGIVYSLFFDQAGVLWVGTNGGGVTRMIPIEGNFPFWTHDPDDPGSLPAGKVTEIYEDQDDRLWVGVYNGGLNLWLPEEQRWKHYLKDPDDPYSLSNNIVTSVYEAKDGSFWICTNEGLNRFDREEERFYLFRPDLDGVGEAGDDIVYDILEDKPGSYWIATYRGGIVHWEEENGDLRFFRHDPADLDSISDNMAFTLLLDEDNGLWIGTNRGLNHYLPEEDRFISYRHHHKNRNGISADTIRTMKIDSRGRFWVGTAGGGLNLLDRQSGNFRFWSREDGFPDNTILSIMEDREGQLWVATPRGLGVFMPEKDRFKLLDANDGIIGEEFNIGAFRNRKDELYFGSLSGVVKVLPSDFRENSHIPPVHLTGFNIFDSPYDSEHSLTELDSVVLSHRQNFISFEFAALDFTDPKKNEYMYRLKGFDRDWIYAGTRRYVSYTNLSGGDYIFQVRGSNNDGVWNMRGRSLKIRVIPPFWKRPAAIVLYAIALFLMIMIIVYLTFRNQRRRLAAEERRLEHERMQLLEREIVEREKIEHQLRIAKDRAEEAAATKNNFIASMSHEFRTPLHAIIGYADFIRQRSARGSIKNYGKIIKKNGEQLNRLVGDILDQARSESGKIPVVLVESDPRNLLEDVVSIIRPLAEKKGVGLSSISSQEIPSRVGIDEAKVRQILINLGGNAVKFTEEGQIRYGLSVEGQSLLWTVQDSGIGIPEAERERIFLPFEQRKGQHPGYGGSGLGLSISKNLADAMGGELSVQNGKGGGALFTLRTPYYTDPDLIEASQMDNPVFSGSEYAERDLFEDDDSGEELYDRVQNLNDEERLSLLALTTEELRSAFLNLSSAWFLEEWKEFSLLVQETARWRDSELLLEIGELLEEATDKASLGELKRWHLLLGELFSGMK